MSAMPGVNKSVGYRPTLSTPAIILTSFNYIWYYIIYTVNCIQLPVAINVWGQFRERSFLRASTFSILSMAPLFWRFAYFPKCFRFAKWSLGSLSLILVWKTFSRVSNLYNFLYLIFHFETNNRGLRRLCWRTFQPSNSLNPFYKACSKRTSLFLKK